MSLKKTAEEIYRSILYRAADIYNVDYDDVDRDVGQNFDPVVRFISGAMASELEKVYQHLDSTENRLQNRLAKVLLPEYYHLPQPAHALARANAHSDSFIIDEKTEFEVDSEDDEKEGIAFSPLYPSRILPANIVIVASEHGLVDIAKKGKEKRNLKGEIFEVQRFALGIQSSEHISNWQGATLYFNLRESRSSRKDEAHFLVAMSNCMCSAGDQKLNSRKGLPSSEVELEDYLNGNEKLQGDVRARYEQNFITFTESDLPEIQLKSTSGFLKYWYKSIGKPEGEIEELVEKDRVDPKDELFWVEIHLPYPVEIENFKTRIQLELNVFPIVNRRLNGNSKSEHHFLKNNSIKWVSLEPKEDYLGIRKVYQEKPPEYPEFKFKPFAEFKEDRNPSYTLRFGGVGRWDEYNAWQRLAYIVGVLRENYKLEELIDEAISSLSLEEVHHLLGRKISKSASDEKPTKDIYVLLHSGVSASIRVRVEYWTSIGVEANNIPAKVQLNCISKHKSNFEKESVELVTSSRGGRAPLNSIEQLNAMKSALLSRGRIVTREDVKGFCRSFLSDKIEDVVVTDSVGTDPRFNFGMTRMLKVELKPNVKFQKEDWSGICRQVQTLLEKKSTSSIPIIVQETASMK